MIIMKIIFKSILKSTRIFALAKKLEIKIFEI